MTGTSTSRRPHRWQTPLMPTWLVIAVVAFAGAAGAQPGPTVGDETSSVEAALGDAAAAQSEAAPPATLTYANRPIVEFRSPLLGRYPAERVKTAQLVLDELIDSDLVARVHTRRIGPVISVDVGARHVFAILPADVDVLAGETQASVAEAAVRRLQVALDEVIEQSRPRQLLVGAVQTVLATIAAVVLVWLLAELRRIVRRRLGDAARSRLQASTIGNVLRTSRIVDVVQGTVTLLSWAVGLFIAYAWLTFGLRRFPYTRPWGESLRGFLASHLSSAGAAIVNALPGLFTVFLIVLGMRLVARLVSAVTQAVEQGRVSVPGVYPETAQSTRKLVTVGLWMFALALAYPYLPGSDSDAFKGVSVFVGLMVSLGSSGLVNQVMSGFTLTYSRALRVGDFVSVGDIEGTVAQLGTLSTKVLTPRGEEVTIPNAVVVSQTVTNYTMLAGTRGVFVPTEITIGYDVPWRQVRALLLLAASRTPGVRPEPAPVVRQSALEDFYIRYTLLFCLEHPPDRRSTLADVHANIVDAFNEFGVQITSPNYQADPDTLKVVPRDRWFEAPATPPSPPDNMS